MVAYCESRDEKDKTENEKGKTEFIEFLVLYNLIEKKEIARITLDLDDTDKNNLDEAYNLFILSNDSQTLIARSDDRKSLKIVSLEDGSVLQETK